MDVAIPGRDRSLSFPYIFHVLWPAVFRYDIGHANEQVSFVCPGIIINPFCNTALLGIVVDSAVLNCNIKA